MSDFEGDDAALVESEDYVAFDFDNVVTVADNADYELLIYLTFSASEMTASSVVPIARLDDSLIVGRAFAVWMHWEKLLSVPSFTDVRIIR